MGIMRGYGARVVVQPGDGDADEIHEITFPNRDAFDAYRDDPRLLALAELRTKSIAKTEITEAPHPAP